MSFTPVFKTRNMLRHQEIEDKCLREFSHSFYDIINFVDENILMSFSPRARFLSKKKGKSEIIDF